MRRVGGLAVSPIGLGTTSFGKYCDERASARVVHSAVDQGIILIDTADSYGAGRNGRAEEILGRTLRGRRDRVVLATKVGTEFAGRSATASAAWIRRAAEGSLRRLGTDHIDLYLLHVPDPVVPIEETLGAMAELVRAGAVREIGCCNLSPAQLAAAAAVGQPPVRWAQDEYNVLARSVEDAILPFCHARDIAFVAYAPLAYGLLTGKYDFGVPPGTRLSQMGTERAGRIRTPAAVAAARRFSAYSRQVGVPPTQLALAWLLSRDTVDVAIPGATSVAQVVENAAAARLAPLPAGVVGAIDALAAGAVNPAADASRTGPVTPGQ